MADAAGAALGADIGKGGQSGSTNGPSQVHASICESSVHNRQREVEARPLSVKEALR